MLRSGRGGPRPYVRFRMLAVVVAGATVAVAVLSVYRGSVTNLPSRSRTSMSHIPTHVPLAARSAPPTDGLGPWKLVFDAQFQGSSLDRSQWTVGHLGPGITAGVNPWEQECYDPKQVRLTGGTLELLAARKQETCNGKKQPFASGYVSTAGKFRFRYGYIEARILLPTGPRGIADWPAFWAVGRHWPEDGEIDILEGIGGFDCVHFITRASHNPGACSRQPLAGAWHTFAADWEPRSLTFYVDGTKVFTQRRNITNKPMILILNLALSAIVTAPDTAPAVMRVRYVKVWQH